MRRAYLAPCLDAEPRRDKLSQGHDGTDLCRIINMVPVDHSHGFQAADSEAINTLNGRAKAWRVGKSSLRRSAGGSTGEGRKLRSTHARCGRSAHGSPTVCNDWPTGAPDTIVPLHGWARCAFQDLRMVSRTVPYHHRSHSRQQEHCMITPIPDRPADAQNMEPSACDAPAGVSVILARANVSA